MTVPSSATRPAPLLGPKGGSVCEGLRRLKSTTICVGTPMRWKVGWDAAADCWHTTRKNHVLAPRARSLLHAAAGGRTRQDATRQQVSMPTRVKPVAKNRRTCISASHHTCCLCSTASRAVARGPCGGGRGSSALPVALRMWGARTMARTTDEGGGPRTDHTFYCTVHRTGHYFHV